MDEKTNNCIYDKNETILYISSGSVTSDWM